VVDLIDAFRLQETSWDKKGFMGYIKGFMKKVAEKLSAERKEAFMAAAPAAVKELLAKFDELQFFTGETMDLEGSMCYAYYSAHPGASLRRGLSRGSLRLAEEGASDPTFLYFKCALAVAIRRAQS
jgi:hypothetical protein